MPHLEIEPVVKDPAEERLVTLDFTPLLGSTESLTGTGATVTAEKLDGTDVTATIIVFNSLSVVSPLVQWKMQGGVDGDAGTMQLTVSSNLQKFAIPVPYRIERTTALVITPFLNATSYVTLLQAQTYFNSRLFTDAWDGADRKAKEKALRMAVSMLNSLTYKGFKYDDDQPLMFPRDYTFDQANDPAVPQEVKDAQCEQALYLLSQGRAIEARASAIAQGVRSYSVPGMSESLAEYAQHVWNMIAPRARQLLAVHVDWEVRVDRG